MFSSCSPIKFGISIAESDRLLLEESSSGEIRFLVSSESSLMLPGIPSAITGLVK